MAKYFIALVILLAGCSAPTTKPLEHPPLTAGLSQLADAQATASAIGQQASTLSQSSDEVTALATAIAQLRAELYELAPLLILPEVEVYQRLIYPTANNAYLLPSQAYPYGGLLSDRTIALLPEKLIEEHQRVFKSDQALGIEAMLIVASSLTADDALWERKQQFLIASSEQLAADLDQLNQQWQLRLAQSYEDQIDFIVAWRVAYQRAGKAMSLDSTAIDALLGD